MEEGHKCGRDESGGLSHSLLGARGIMSHRDLLHASETTPCFFAAMIAAVNDARLAAGKGPVGFINPAVRSTFSARCTIHDARGGADECARSTDLLSQVCGRVP